jgi:hypothetical protein
MIGIMEGWKDERLDAAAGYELDGLKRVDRMGEFL